MIARASAAVLAAWRENPWLCGMVVPFVLIAGLAVSDFRRGMAARRRMRTARARFLEAQADWNRRHRERGDAR